MLTDAKIRTAKPGVKAVKLVDGGGLHLVVTPAGGKLWRLRYEFGGKEKLLSIGAYPGVTLLMARDARTAAKANLAAGIDPGEAKKRQKARAAASSDDSFETIAREWHTLQKGTWSEIHADDVIESLENHVFPKLGKRAITDISPPDVLDVLREIEKRPAIETARRVRQRMSAVFVYAIAIGKGRDDPAAIVVKALAPLVRGRQPAITDLKEARKILTDASAVPAHPVTKLALRILALTIPRPGTLVTTPWSEWGDLAGALWQIPAVRMKLALKHKGDEARDHLSPLPWQAIEAIEVLRRLTGRGPIAFPNTRHAHKPMSENAIGYLLNRAGYHHRHVPHGWRSTFSTVMNERFPQDRAVIDLMLAHVPKDKVEGAYNRAAYLPRRTELAQLWANLILEGQPPAADLLLGPRR